MDVVVRNGECGDWRLADAEFLKSFTLPERTPDKLARLHPLPEEDRLRFDASIHKYFLDGRQIPISVTGLLHKYATSFNAAAALISMKNGARWPEKEADLIAQGLGTDDQDFLVRWERNGQAASARGTLMHFQCECLVNDISVEAPHSPEFQQAQIIYQQLLKMGMTPYRTELSMYNTKLDCAGQADLIMRDEGKDCLVIVDWKRVRQMKFDNRYEHLKYPFQHLPDCNGSLYAMQLSVYAHFLESDYNMKVADDMYLALCHPDNPGPQLIRVRRLRLEIQALVDHESAPSAP